LTDQHRFLSVPNYCVVTRISENQSNLNLSYRQSHNFPEKFLFSTATSATDSLLAECHHVMVLQKCCSGDAFNTNLTF